MEDLERSTEHLDTLALWIAFDYGGRAEIVEAARRCLEDGLAPEDCRRGRARGAALCARARRDRPPDPHLRRVPHLELPPLGDGVCGARLHRHPLARLRGRRPPRRARHVRGPRAEVRRRGERVLVAHRRRARAAAGRARDRLARWLVALRGRARGRADGVARALRDGARPAADRPRRLRRARATLLGAELGGVTWMLGGSSRRSSSRSSSTASPTPARPRPRRSR